MIDLSTLVIPTNLEKPIGNPNDLIERSHRLLQKFENPYSKSKDSKKGKNLANGRFRSIDHIPDEDPLEGINIQEKNGLQFKRKLSIVQIEL